LEEADIIPADKAKVKGKEKEGKDLPAMGGVKVGGNVVEAAASEGGMGKLDIGWLNSRSGRVERDMEGELWEKAKKFLEGEKGDKDEDVEMGT